MQVGAILGLNQVTNGLRDPAMYADLLEPKILHPLHHDIITENTSSDDFEEPLRAELATYEHQPELRFLTDPYDYLRPGLMTYDPAAPAWATVDPDRPSATCARSAPAVAPGDGADAAQHRTLSRTGRGAVDGTRGRRATGGVLPMTGARAVLVPLALVLFGIALGRLRELTHHDQGSHFSAVVAVLVAVGPAAFAATTDEQQLLLTGGRVFLELIQSVDFIQYGADPERFLGGMAFLEERHSEWLEFTDLQALTDDDARPSVLTASAWHPDDTGDGLLPTSSRSRTIRADVGKEYVLPTFAHSSETCGREAVLRSIEDLAIAASTDDERTWDTGVGTFGDEESFTARELLARTKIIVAFVAPDGWASGDDNTLGFSQDNGAGVNGNRVAHQTGWVFPDEPQLRENGYTVATQPEGAAFTEWLREVRATELGGRPFAVAADIHGPVPVGFLLLHDQGNDAVKLERLEDLGTRVASNMDEVLATYATGEGANAFNQAARQVESVIDELEPFLPRETGATTGDATFVPLEWAAVTHIWDGLNYTASGTWGGWANSNSAGLGADSLSYEINCLAFAPYDPARMQLFVDNARSIVMTSVAVAASRADATTEVPTRDLVVRRLVRGRPARHGHRRQSPPPPRLPADRRLSQVSTTSAAPTGSARRTPWCRRHWSRSVTWPRSGRGRAALPTGSRRTSRRSGPSSSAVGTWS